MKKLDFYKNAMKVSLLAFLLILLANPVMAGKKIDLSEMTLELSKIECEKLGIMVWDQRIMVKDLSQPEAFLGYVRTIVGIAYGYDTKSGQIFTDLMLSKIKDAYQVKGVDVNTIQSSSQDSEDQIMDKINSSGDNTTILIKLNELHFDGVMKIEYVVNMDILAYNSEGEVVYKNNITRKIPLGKTGKRKKTVPATLKSLFEEALNNPDIIAAAGK
jgi:hypothetical protein